MKLRPNKILIPYALIFIVSGILMFLGMKQSKNADDYIVSIIWFSLMPIFTGVITLFWTLTKEITVDSKGLSGKVFGMTQFNYTWEEISSAKIIHRERYGFPISIYSNRKRICKISRLYKGYEYLLYELLERNLMVVNKNVIYAIKLSKKRTPAS